MIGILKRIWRFFTKEEGMTWERYQRNMDIHRRDRK